MRISRIAMVAAWGAASLGVLRLADIEADLGEEALCGPWGCLPPLQALLAIHGFWFMAISPFAVQAIRAGAPSQLATSGRLLIGGALAGLALAAAAIAWRDHDHFRGEAPHHLLPHVGIEIITMVDLPFFQVLAAGLALRIAGRRKARADARAPGPMPIVAMALIGLAALAGCDRPGGATAAGGDRTGPDPHGHAPGSRGVVIVPIDGKHAHAEAIFTADGEIKIHMLAEDEARILEVESQTLAAFVRPRDSIGTKTVELVPVPQPGDSEGKTSAFAGKLPEEMKGRALVVAVPSIRIGGERLRFGFESPEIEHAPAMPAKVEDDAERLLYLTPGGKYTEADIAANGRQTASQKFKDFRASHDASPAPGAKVCPITQTKANPSCTWVIGGKPYEFCCPPCIDEFVRAAKESPELIKEPSEYIKK